MKYTLTARNRTTKKDEKITEFDDERQFDFMLDSVDKNKYEDAMILEGQICRKYITFKLYEPYEKRRVKKDDKRR